MDFEGLHTDLVFFSVCVCGAACCFGKPFWTPYFSPTLPFFGNPYLSLTLPAWNRYIFLFGIPTFFRFGPTFPHLPFLGIPTFPLREFLPFPTFPFSRIPTISGHGVPCIDKHSTVANLAQNKSIAKLPATMYFEVEVNDIKRLFMIMCLQFLITHSFQFWRIVFKIPCVSLSFDSSKCQVR